MIFCYFVLMCNSLDNLYWHAATIWQMDLLKYTLCDSYNISTSTRWHIFLLGSCDITLITCFWLLWRLIQLALCLWMIRNMLLLDVYLGSLIFFYLVWHHIDYLSYLFSSILFGLCTERLFGSLVKPVRIVMIEFKYWFWPNYY